MMKKLFLIVAVCPSMLMADSRCADGTCCIMQGSAPAIPANTLTALEQSMVDLTDVLTAMEGAVKGNNAAEAEAQLGKALALTAQIKAVDAAERQACAKAQGKVFQKLVSAAWRVEKAAAGKESLRGITSKATQAVADSFK